MSIATTKNLFFFLGFLCFILEIIYLRGEVFAKISNYKKFSFTLLKLRSGIFKIAFILKFANIKNFLHQKDFLFFFYSVNIIKKGPGVFIPKFVFDI